MRRLFVFFLLIVPIIVYSQKPKLVVGIVVEQMRYDILIKYWDKFSDSGFKKLINEGTICKNAHYNYLNINSASGYATISCGAYPSQHGIINTSWYNRLYNKEENCIEDANYKMVGTKFGTGKSPQKMSSLTWTDQLRISTYKMSKIYSVGIKDYASILSGGKLANAAYWFDENSGNWVTSSYYCDSLKPWVKEFNQKNFVDIYLSRNWETTYEISTYTESLSDATSYEKGFDGKNTFPYNLNLLKSKYNNSKLICYTPFANTYTKDFAVNLLMSEYLGRDPYTDVLMINFSATSYIGDLFSSLSVEMEDTYIKLDKDIAHLIAAIEDYVGKENVVFYLTSDRGNCENQQWLNDINVPTGEFNSTRALVLTGSYLRAIYGYQNWISGFYNNEFYFNNFEIDKASLSLSEFEDKSAKIISEITGVNSVIATHELSEGTFSSGIMQQAQNSYYQERSGDMMIILDYGWRHKDDNGVCECNSGYNENTHVPIIFYGESIQKQSIYRRISLDDLAPTLCFLLDIPLPTKCTGNPIEEILIK